MVPLNSVKPGDLISADFFNQLIGTINDLQSQVALLSGSVGTGSVVVPSVFGLTLAAARTTITAPTSQLVLNAVVDTNGLVVNPAVAANASRLVIGQLPAPGDRVTPGTLMNLVVAASGGASAPPPAITTTTGTTFMNGAMSINGSNFAQLFSDNVVKFAGVAATVLPSSVGNRLDVVVPAGIPGAPTTPGGAALPGVIVTVQVPGGAVAQTTVTINPPPGSPIPIIVPPLSPSTGIVGSNVNITGNNFAATAAANTVTFDGKAGTVTAVNPAAGGASTLTVTVPTNIPGLLSSGSNRTDVPVIVRVNNVDSVPFIGSFFKP